MTEHPVTSVPFHGDTLFAVQADNVIFVAIKAIAVRLGLAWHGQFERIKRDPVLVEGIRVMRIPSASGDQETTLLRFDLLNGWLFGIDTRRVKPELRDRIITYQRECYRVLFDHFYGRAVAGGAVDPAPASDGPADAPRCDGFAPPADLPERTQRLWLDKIALAYRIYGRHAARSLWRHAAGRGLIEPAEEMAAAAECDDAINRGDPAADLEHFLSDRTERGHGLRVSSLALWAAYQGWCADLGITALSRNAFGRAMTAAGFRTIKVSVMHYTGLRLKPTPTLAPTRQVPP